MMRSLCLALFAGLVLAACSSDAPAPADAAAYDTYGASFEPVAAVPVQAALAEPEGYVDRTVVLEGVVREVCQQAGCWLTLDAGDGRYVRIHVARTDSGSYAFTVPKDVAGRRVVVQGTLKAETLSAEEQQHLAEDAGTPPEPADSLPFTPQPEYQLTASGVLVEKART